LFFSKGKWKKEIERAFLNIDKNGVPIFYRVEIETINRCNGACTFCPVNRNDDTRKPAKMTEELFEKILSELKDLDYSGGLSLFCNNEPFLDTRLEAFAKKARVFLPKARIEVFTNGTILTLERFIEIIPYLNLLAIDNYNDDLEWHETVLSVREYIKKHPELKAKVSIRMRKESAVMSTRGGQAPNNSKKKTLPISCLFPFYYITIRPDGKISLCCNDALGKFTLGDVTEQSLKDIWYSEPYNEIRETIRTGRDKLELCKYCDSYANPAKLHRMK